MDKHDQIFAALVFNYQQVGMTALGKVSRPDGKIERNLEEAGFLIDILEMLSEKTKGNLSDDLSRILEQTVSDLRLNFVDESRKKTADVPPESKEAAEENGAVNE
jgi:hypothetical protein